MLSWFGSNKSVYKAVTVALVLLALLAGSFFDVSAKASFSDCLNHTSNSPSGVSVFAEEPNGVSVVPLLEGGPDISSAAAVVMDIKSGAILYAKNPLEAHQPSSLTKLVTMLVVLDTLASESNVSFSAAAASQDFPTASNAGYWNGDTSSVKDLLTAMIMCSADDCAYALAERAGGSMDGFAEMMNSYAAENGLTHSNFLNSNGRHVDGHYTCAYDMALAARELMNNVPEFRQAASGKSATISASGSALRNLSITNTHRFISGNDSYDYSYAGKTGGTAYGGDGTWSLCTFASVNGLDLVCIITGAPSNDSTYADTKLLFNYAFENFEAVSANSFLSSSTTEIGTLFNDDLLFASDGAGSIFTDSKASIILPKNADTGELVSNIHFNQIHEYVYGNNVIGGIDFFYNDIFAGSVDILFYTENASMTQSQFNGSFPSFLIRPESNQGSNIYSFDNTDEAKVTKPTFIDKIKSSVYSLYTPAKSFAAICAILIFLIGTLVIFLVFPTESKQKDKLYKKEYDVLTPPLYEDELSEIHSVRKPEVDDMHEIT